MKKFVLDNQETADICRGLALLLHAGITLADGMFLLAEEENGEKKELLTALGTALDGGMLPADAMEESGAFDAYASGMVRVGQRTGRLEESLGALADFYAERSRTEKQLRSAVTYPGMILLLMIVVIGVLLIKVLPVFDEVYASLGAHLTGIAGGLLVLGQVLKGAMPVLWVVLAAGTVLAVLYARWGAFRNRADAWLRGRFGDRGVNAKFNNARFARALAMGLGSGLPLEEAAELGWTLLRDVPGAAARCEGCVAALKAGTSLTEALGGAGLLNAGACRMLNLGMRGGNGEQVMDEIAGRMMAEAEDALQQQISRIEPAMVLAASALVGMILLAVMLPLMNIMASLG